MSTISFEDYEIPYSHLEKVGFSKESIESLPEDVFRNLLMGESTPLLSSTVKDGQRLRASIRLFRDDSGVVDAMYVPYKQIIHLETFSEEEKAALMQGEVILTDNGGNAMYCQFDEKTNQVMTAPAQRVESNIEMIRRDYPSIDADIVSKGGLSVSMENDAPTTAGIDLSTSGGVRLSNGDKEQWLLDKKRNARSEYSFGLYGCWVADKDNGLKYVPEEEYDDRMVRAMEDQMDRNKQRGMHMGM